MFNQNWLNPDDRALYEDMLYDAIIMPNGSCRPTAEAGQRLFDALHHIADMHEWAHQLIAESARQSLGRRAKHWAKQMDFISTPFGQRMVEKSARIAVKRRNDAGRSVDQLVLCETATSADLIAVINRNSQMADGLAVDTATATKLLKLCRLHQVESVPEALAAQGCSLETFLASTGEATA